MGHKERIQNNGNRTKGIIVIHEKWTGEWDIIFFKAKHVAALKMVSLINSS